MRIALALLACVVAPSVGAQEVFPTKPVRMVNPFPPGGPVDVVGRPVFDRMRTALGQPVIVDYRPGASTMIGSALVAKAAPDGYTLLATAGQHTINPSVLPKLPYDTVNDFASVSMMATGPYVLAVHPSVPARSVADLVRLAKAAPGRLTFASASPGSGFHMAAELFKLEEKIDIRHIPYKGGAPAGTALLSGEVDMMFASPAVVIQHVKTARLRALAVTTPNRFPLLPDVPTMKESGRPDFDARSWYGIFAPSATPVAVIDRIAASIDRIVRTPEVREVFAQAGLEPAGGTAQWFHQRVTEDMRKWAKVAKEGKITVE